MDERELEIAILKVGLDKGYDHIGRDNFGKLCFGVGCPWGYNPQTNKLVLANDYEHIDVIMIRGINECDIFPYLETRKHGHFSRIEALLKVLKENNPLIESYYRNR